MRKISRLLIMVLGLVFLFPACAPQVELAPTQTHTSSPEPETPTATVALTDTSEPGRVILVVPPGANAEKTETYRSALQAAADARGLQFVEQETSELAQSTEGLVLVVVLSPADGIQSLANRLPQVQFIASGSEGISPTENLTVISEEEGSVNAAFLAGYIAAIESEEYRIGLISVSTPAGQAYREAYLNGVIYFCGTCTPVFPPFVVYPVYAEVSEKASLEVVQQAANDLINSSVTLVHVSPEIQSEPIYQYLSQNGIRIVGTSMPPAGLEGNWVASVLLEPQQTLQNVIETALNGQSSGRVGAELRVDFSGLSQARISHLEEIILKLESGEIDPVGNTN